MTCGLNCMHFTKVVFCGSAPCAAINNVEYNVTDYLHKHPGGAAVMLELNGKDATRAFEDVGHSKSAYAMLRTGMLTSAQKLKSSIGFQRTS
jgi:cytochrome b involved in lipid metabolism